MACEQIDFLVPFPIDATQAKPGILSYDINSPVSQKFNSCLYRLNRYIDVGQIKLISQGQFSLSFIVQAKTRLSRKMEFDCVAPRSTIRHVFYLL